MAADEGPRLHNAEASCRELARVLTCHSNCREYRQAVEGPRYLRDRLGLGHARGKGDRRMRIIKRWTSRAELKAVYPDDLEAVLKDAGLLDLLQRNKLKCKKCGRLLTITNIACLVKTETGFQAICSGIECCRVIESTEGSNQQ